MWLGRQSILAGPRSSLRHRFPRRHRSVSHLIRPTTDSSPSWSRVHRVEASRNRAIRHIACARSSACCSSSRSHALRVPLRRRFNPDDHAGVALGCNTPTQCTGGPSEGRAHSMHATRFASKLLAKTSDPHLSMRQMHRQTSNNHGMLRELPSSAAYYHLAISQAHRAWS